MDMDEYQRLARQTCKDSSFRLDYLVLGLASEAGEVAGKLKKIIRDRNGAISPQDVAQIAMETGDCQWYVAMICEVLGLSLSEVARANADHLADRKARGVIGGSGDDR